MTKNENDLIEMIRKNDNPQHALLVAIGVIVGFLNRPESTELKSSADSPEHA